MGEAKVKVGPRPLKTEMDEDILFLKKNCVSYLSSCVDHPFIKR